MRIVGIILTGLTVALIAAAAPPIVHAETGSVVVTDDGRLTVHARATPLATLLRLIASRSGVGLAAVGDLDAPVTVDLDGAALDEAIPRLAWPHATVWVVAPSPGAVNAASTPMDVPDARLRQRATLSVGATRTPQSAAALRAGLADPVVSVRVQAAYALRQSEGIAAIPTLADLAATDPEPRVRLAAVRALSFLPGESAARALEVAGRDPDASVRREAIRGLSTR